MDSTKPKKKKKSFGVRPTPAVDGGSRASSGKSVSSSVRSTPVVDGGSRASSGKSVSSSQLTNSMTDLKNDSSTDFTRGYDLKAHLAQILTFSDEEEDEFSSDDYSLESFDGEERLVEEELKRLVGNGVDDGQPRTPRPTDTNNCQSLVPITEENDDLDSEEENAIMKEIRDEITNNVREEMKSELELYKMKLKKLEKQQKIADGEPVDTESEAGDTKGVEDELNNLDPKLKLAIIKMKKLDKILAKRVRREKEVKRDRILLERRLRREIEEMHKEVKSEYKEVKTNEDKFLALELPSRHNEGIDTGSSENFSGPYDSEPENIKQNNDITDHDKVGTDCSKANEESSSGICRLITEAWASTASQSDIGVTVPDEFTGEEVFATQLNEDEYPGILKEDGQGSKSRKTKSRSTRNDSRQGSEDSESRGDASSVASGSVQSKGKHRRRGKDFIKRNRELAADAGNAIAMTDEEKKRLDDLLLDVDKITEIPEDMELDESNPFQIAIKPGEGFHPDADERRTLTSIDSRLKDIMPREDYESIASSSTMSYAPQNKLFTHTGVKHAHIDWESRGEKALFQNAEQREMNERMFAIEQELSALHNPEEHELDTPRLGEDQLQDLIEQCVTSLSMSNLSRLTLNSESRTSMADTESIMSHDIDMAGGDTTPRMLSPTSARRELLEHPPKLAPDVLQKLLSEAYHPLSKELSALQEVDNEDDEESTPVPAEVWKLIAMEEPNSESYTESEENHRNVYNTENNVIGAHEPLGGSHFGVNLMNQSNSRNGFRTPSRSSSNSESKPLKLPEIDPTGTLVTQRLHMNGQRGSGNQRTGSGASSRMSVNSIRSSMSDFRQENGESVMDMVSVDGDVMTPRPPSEKREGSASSIKSRTVTPSMKIS